MRDKYRIEEGDTVIYVDLGDHIVLIPSPKDPLEVLAGVKIETEEAIHENEEEGS